MTGLAATCRRLPMADRRTFRSRVVAKRRPRRVASTIPIRAATTARISNSLLAGGSLNAWARLRLAKTKKMTSRITWTIAPASALSPTAATPADGSTPDFCR